MQRKALVVRILAIALIAVFTVISVGCNKTAEPKSTTQSAGGTTTAATTVTQENEMVGNMYKTGLPIVEKPVTFNLLGLQMNNTRKGRLDETDMIKKLEAETGVKIVWELVPQASWSEKKNLIVASRELPDAFFGPKSLTADESQKFGTDGVLIPLNDLLDQYAPNIRKAMAEYPMYTSAVTSLDGNIYSLGALRDEGFDSLIAGIINKKWLDELNLPVPTTTDEFYNALKAFKTNDMNKNGKADEIPFSFLFQEGKDVNREVKRDFRWVYFAFGSMDNPFHIEITDNDQVIFTASTNEYKEATKYMHKLYSEGLIDPEVFTQDRTLLTNKVRTQQSVGSYSDYRKDSSIVVSPQQEEFAHIPALKGPNGTQVWARADVTVGEGAFAITNSCKTPEILVRYLDYWNEPENAVQMAFGMFKEAGFSETEALIPSEKVPGKYEVNTKLRPENVEPSDWYFSAPIAQGCTLLTKADMDKYLAEKESSVAKLASCEVYSPYLTKWPYNYPYKFTADEIEELSLLQTDIVNYIENRLAKWITEGGIDESWDNYLSELKKLGVDRYTELYRTSFERIEGAK